MVQGTSSSISWQLIEGWSDQAYHIIVMDGQRPLDSFIYLFFQASKKRLGQYNLSVVLSNFRLTSNSWLRMLVVDVNSLDGEVNAVLSVQLGS